MTDREEVRERLAELEQEVAALRRRLESAPSPREGGDRAVPPEAPAGADAGEGAEAGAAEEGVAGIGQTPGGPKDHVR